MLAIRLAVGLKPDKTRRYALMPSFTFAATAHAAIWAGLTPLLCDIEPDTWLPAHSAQKQLLGQYGNEVCRNYSYATFGNNLDLNFYGGSPKSTAFPSLSMPQLRWGRAAKTETLSARGFVIPSCIPCM